MINFVYLDNILNIDQNNPIAIFSVLAFREFSKSASTNVWRNSKVQQAGESNNKYTVNRIFTKNIRTQLYTLTLYRKHIFP